MLVRVGLVVALLGIVLTVYKVVWPSTKTAADVAREVGIHVGDGRPRIVWAESTTTDNPPHHPMYLMTIEGRFRNGRQTARYLTFSALADTTYV